MKKKNLLDIVYKYYPRNVDCINRKEFYISTKEYKNLLIKINISKKEYSKNKLIINDLKKISENWGDFNDLTYFEWLDRCYTFEIIKKNNNTFFQLKIYQSILAPFYFIKFYEIKPIDERFKYYEISENNFFDPNYILTIESIMKKNNLEKFDSKLINLKIRDINFDDIELGSFTFFNAFFNSQNI